MQTAETKTVLYSHYQAFFVTRTTEGLMEGEFAPSDLHDLSCDPHVQYVIFHSSTRSIQW